ncbi:hypothetical protein RRG08_043097 [Elysia crispata]|uniref:Uncharacterized protein n=1 Tax=Elysia crispata TaxID=231223 RepID=A0AAE1CP74_9GAST|nr:hypothetical protein RRG08_043097 [Elysia crispata]
MVSRDFKGDGLKDLRNIELSEARNSEVEQTCVRSVQINESGVRTLCSDYPLQLQGLARVAKESKLDQVQVLVEYSCRVALGTWPLWGYRLSVSQEETPSSAFLVDLSSICLRSRSHNSFSV